MADSGRKPHFRKAALGCGLQPFATATHWPKRLLAKMLHQGVKDLTRTIWTDAILSEVTSKPYEDHHGYQHTQGLADPFRKPVKCTRLI